MVRGIHPPGSMKYIYVLGLVSIVAYLVARDGMEMCHWLPSIFLSLAFVSLVLLNRPCFR